MKPLRIAFVSSHPSMRRFRRDASFIYRCENLALALADMGHQVSLLHLNALLFRSDFDIAVFSRPAHSRVFDWVVRRLRKRGAMLVADLDDLIFDPEYARFRPSVLSERSEQDKTRHKFARHGKALQAMDTLQFSVSELADHYLALQPDADCAVIPNAAHHSWKAIAPMAAGGERRISYFSGTRTHDRDFALVAPVLARLLERHADLVVQLVGPVQSGFDHPRLRRLSKVGFAEYAQVVRASHLCIAPLEDTPFNRCKSALKAVEAGAMNVPTVASPVGEYARLRVDGVLHADGADEWERQLEYALDPANYARLSTGLRERMSAYSDAGASAQAFLEFVSRRSMADSRS